LGRGARPAACTQRKAEKELPVAASNNSSQPPTNQPIHGRLHAEPLSDVLFTKEAVFTACHGGQIKCWARPATQPQLGDGVGANAAAGVAQAPWGGGGGGG